MSVLIKGMEIPRNCWECKFSSEYDVVDGTALGCLITMKTKEKDLKPIPDWCPLVEVPPHGKLIDADVMIKRYEPDMNRQIYGGNFIHDLECAPTVIPADKDGENG